MATPAATAPSAPVHAQKESLPFAGYDSDPFAASTTTLAVPTTDDQNKNPFDDDQSRSPSPQPDIEAGLRRAAPPARPYEATGAHFQRKAIEDAKTRRKRMWIYRVLIVALIIALIIVALHMMGFF
jgi:hypothetical protein